MPYWPVDVPMHAQCTTYYAQNGRYGKYYVWANGDMWYWQALGNNGEEKTELAACVAAKRWIKDRQ